MTTTDYGIVLTAKPITATPDKWMGETTHRLGMGLGNVAIHIDPETAAQWVEVLKEIAASEQPEIRGI